MGILCQSCNSENNENNISEKNDSHLYSKGIITLPKDMVSSMNNKIHENKKENIQQNEKEEKIFKFEHDDEKDNK